ncbi:nitroreductase/quinone reductase family protein [Nonomuraea sp. M3C6]|uniref:Nitroreductase/quinone reductase family protein n=1 Tax=Nonomuraea marmarensis TaxID=3351344 RepID=A0ABW7AQX3_9ACTN
MPSFWPVASSRQEHVLLLVVASAGGAPRHPVWYHNVLAHPAVRVELGREVFPAIATPAEGARRDRLFEQVVRVAPGYATTSARRLARSRSWCWNAGRLRKCDNWTG